jgi:hypothetical protein
MDSLESSVFPGVTEFDAWGYSIAGATDFDGDGRIEFIIGAPGNDPGGSYPGRVYFVKTDLVVGVKAPRRLENARSFQLFQNYPNPFNPETVISGQWTVDSRVRLVVCDLLGREVAVLADGRYPAGRHQFSFDGSNLASGVYFYRLTAGSYSATKSMLLIR